MGAGTALAFKYKYPEMFDKYAELCKEEKLKLGNLWLYDVPNGNKKVLNVAIKEHWKHHVTYDTVNYSDPKGCLYVSSIRNKICGFSHLRTGKFKQAKGFKPNVSTP